MLRKDINLSEVLDYYKKNKVASFDEDFDKFGDYFITAGRIAAVILAPTPIAAIANFCSGIDAASLRASKLLSWLPDKFKFREKGREKFALERYELASVVNFMLLQIAIKNGVKDVIMPTFSSILTHVKFEEDDGKELEKIAQECDKEVANLKLPLHCSLTKIDFENHSFKIVEPIFSALIKLIEKKSKEEKSKFKKINFSKVKEKYLEKTIVYYNAFIINFSSEFSEFALWAETGQRSNILKELNDLSKKLEANDKKVNELFIKNTEQILNKIEELRRSDFIQKCGFPTFDESYKAIFKLQVQRLVSSLSSKIRDNIEAHQNKIKGELNRPLIENQDIEGIVYPRNKDIYIAQSFQSIVYKKKEHKKGFLTAASLGEFGEKGQNIGNFLLQTLIDPNCATRPIILLGNPGAGKSMLSKMFAGLLCETNDFIPFLIKLRSVASNTANISEHINKGLSKSIESTTDINWLDWAREFRERIPVIIMDGFDELMQSSNTELNNYLNTIKEFQDTALNHGIAVRVILTSRVTVMQDVFIPDGTRIIKLDSFDQKRRDLWVKIWNENQNKKGYKFIIPKNVKIEHLAQEPLLMFMLAVYDFEKSELQHMTKEKNFNQSKLYDSLLNNFIERQLKKNELYTNANSQQQKREEELFRLRLGMIALMMYLNDSTHKDTQKLTDELESFGLHESKIQTDNVLGGFFFIHENKSTTEGELEKLNYEFLHKTFGEFLAADFMLRVALKQCERSREKIYQRYIFKFCFGYNWLHKHYNIQNFLFEHAHQIIKPKSKELDILINDVIKPDIEILFGNGNVEFPVKENQIQPHKQVVEHLAIYSQNLIFLWVSLSNENEEIRFEIFDINEKIGDGISEPKYESQDRNETNKNKLLWKRLAKLWTLVGNYNATAKLNEWIKVKENENDILLSKQTAEVSHNFSDSSRVACNDFELLLSFFDNENKFSKEFNVLVTAEQIIRKKPELTSLAIDSMLHRFNDLFPVFNLDLLKWFKDRELSRRQQVDLMKKVTSIKWDISTSSLMDIFAFITREMSFTFLENQQVTIEYLKLVIDLKSYYPLTELLNENILEEAFHRISDDMRYLESDNPIAALEYLKILNEFNKHFPYRRKIKGDIIDESVYRISRSVNHLMRDNPYSAFAYLQILNELRANYPVFGKQFHVEFLDDLLRQISKDIKYLAKVKPQAILEYLKLLNDIRKNFHMKEEMVSELYGSALVYMVEESENLLGNESFELLEFIKIFLGLKRYYPIEKMIPRHVLKKYLERLSRDLYYFIRHMPKNATEYFNVMKSLISSVPEKYYTALGEGIFDELIHHLLDDFKLKVIKSHNVIFIFLELVLINSSKFRRKEDNHALNLIIETILEHDFGTRVIQKSVVLLIKYNASQKLVEMLLDKHPKLKAIFLNYPEIAREIIETINEIGTNERYN